MLPKVTAHIVTYNSKPSVLTCIKSILAQNGFVPSQNLLVEVTDNASSNQAVALIKETFEHENITIYQNHHNLGFCGAHNQGVKRFLERENEFLLVLNPDVRLEPNTIRLLVEALTKHPEAGTATPKLYRAQGDLNPIHPPIIDAAGMYMTPSLRHFDRGSGEKDRLELGTESFVFGGTGACLLMRRDFVEDMLLVTPIGEQELFTLYQQLREGLEQRAPLFDEAFFAYREDADLAWRAQLFGWSCIYVPQAICYHERVVLPERRRDLNPILNSMSVRNRFLLQVNNYSFFDIPGAILPGFFVRNILVLLGVVFCERTSMSAIWEFWSILPRALRRRHAIFEKARKKGRGVSVSRWFKSRAFAQERSHV